MTGKYIVNFYRFHIKKAGSVDQRLLCQISIYKLNFNVVCAVNDEKGYDKLISSSEHFCSDLQKYFVYYILVCNVPHNYSIIIA